MPACCPLLACVLFGLLQHVLVHLLVCVLAAFLVHSVMYSRLSNAAILNRPNFKAITWDYLVVYCCISWGNKSFFTCNTIIWYVKWIDKSHITTIIKAVFLSNNPLLEQTLEASVLLSFFMTYYAWISVPWLKMIPVKWYSS